MSTKGLPRPNRNLSGKVSRSGPDANIEGVVTIGNRLDVIECNPPHLA